MARAVDWPLSPRLRHQPVVRIAESGNGSFSTLSRTAHTKTVHWWTPQSNTPSKLIALLLIAEAAFVAATGRGLISIVQGTVGVIVGIEGYWGAAKNSKDSMKRFAVALVFYFIFSVVIAVVNVETVEQYCVGASPKELQYCRNKAYQYAWISLGLSLGAIPIFIIVVSIFWRKLAFSRQQYPLIRTAYEMEYD